MHEVAHFQRFQSQKASGVVVSRIYVKPAQRSGPGCRGNLKVDEVASVWVRPSDVITLQLVHICC